MIYPPVIVVTGPIASGKSTVAGIMAESGGTLLRADPMAHNALEEKEVIDSIKKLYGDRVMAAPDEVSRKALGHLVLGSPEEMERLNSIVGRAVTRIINEAVTEVARTARYIVLDAVLFFKYKFEFRADLVITTEASEQVRIERLMVRDGLEREEAEGRVVSQRYLYPDWERAGIRINTDKDMDRLSAEVAEIRDKALNRLMNPGSGGKNG